MWFWLVVAVILGLTILVSLVLAIPVDAVLDLDVHGKIVLKGKVRWLFGLVTFRPGSEKAPAKPVVVGEDFPPADVVMEEKRRCVAAPGQP